VFLKVCIVVFKILFRKINKRVQKKIYTNFFSRFSKLIQQKVILTNQVIKSVCFEIITKLLNILKFYFSFHHSFMFFSEDTNSPFGDCTPAGSVAR